MPCVSGSSFIVTHHERPDETRLDFGREIFIEIDDIYFEFPDTIAAADPLVLVSSIDDERVCISIESDDHTSLFHVSQSLDDDEGPIHLRDQGARITSATLVTREQVEHVWGTHRRATEQSRGRCTPLIYFMISEGSLDIGVSIPA